VARKRWEEDDELLPGMDSPDDRASQPSSVRPRVRGVAPPKSTVSRVKVTLRILAAAVVAGAGLYGFHVVEQFLIRDPRFALNEVEGTPALEIRGATHASQGAIEAAFREDAGRSVYLMPLGDRQAALRQVDWVKNAAVARAWPNHVVVNIAERTPVAFVTLGAARFGLIDEEGVILPPATDRFHLPVLTGVRLEDSREARKKGVRRMMTLMASLGDAAANVAEVDVSDASNLKVKQSSGGRMVTLLLGDRNFDVRYRNFANHYSEIREKSPRAATLDLRIEDRITVVEE
jgi:cell division protein FtsQ